MKLANIKKRLITGGVALALFAGILFIDRRYEPFIPCLLLTTLAMTWLAGMEFKKLLGEHAPMEAFFTIVPVILIVLFSNCHDSQYGSIVEKENRNWLLLASICLFIIAGFIAVEVLEYRPGTNSMKRLGLSILGLFYLAVLPCMLLEVRWLYGTVILAGTILIPKLGDVAAYFTGSLFGRHPMSPLLSPKKTWEGFAGGMIVSMIVGIVIYLIHPEPFLPGNVLLGAVFGLFVGLAGVFGDLFESLIKREAQTKDASQTLPGFGGILDLVDSILFAAPAAFVFFKFLDFMKLAAQYD